MTIASQPESDFGARLREWRRVRGKSQLTLSLEAGVSARHLSFVETGKSSPSREMVLLLADALDVPLRERNAMLGAAGFAAMFTERPLESPEMEEVRQALGALLDAHDWRPAAVVNRRYDVLMANDAARRLLAFLAPEMAARSAPPNLAELILAEPGARGSIENWPEVAAEMAYRLRIELPQDDPLRDALAVPGAAPARLSPLLTAERRRTTSAYLPLQIRQGEVRLQLFSMISTVGTPLDVTLQELRVESFFPVDAASAIQLRRICAP